jgi:hypothetical protein
MQCHEIGAQGCDDPPGQSVEKPHQESEQGVSRDDKSNRRPFDTERLGGFDFAGVDHIILIYIRIDLYLP